MNQHLQKIMDLLQHDNSLSAEEKMAALKSLKDADKEMEIANFKLDRTEKVKRTTAILLEETIQELEQKRKAVEAQNRELEIESALERVRAVAMSMNKPDDLLSISETMYAELKKLGFADLRNAMINIHYDEKKYLLNYDFAEKTGRTVTSFVYNSHPIVNNIIQHAKQSFDSFTEMIYSGEALNELRAFRKNNGEADDARLDSIGALCYYFYSTGTGAVGISMFSTATQEQLVILKRFRNVFDLAYRRYTDIVTAEAQAREAQIETALERVRSRSMGMHKSDELKEVIRLVLEQLVHLKINAEHAGFYIDYKVHDDMHIWLADPNIEPFYATIPYFDTPTWNSFLEAKAKGTAFHTDLLDFEEKNRFYKSLFKLFTVPEEAKEFYLRCKGLAVSTVLLDNVGLYIENFSGIPYSDEENKILMRFGKVFQQTYTRFLDLQTAEAQTRESQIQLALERVRARTMAMQHSNELADASFVLDSQVRALGINTRGCAFNIYGDSESTEWFSSAEGSLPMYKTPRENVFLRYYEAGQRGEKIYIEEFAGEVCKLHYEYLCTIPIMGDALRGMIAAGGSFPTRQIDHVVYFKYGYLLFLTLEPVPEAHGIFIRFAKVFEQTYTRFLDLQKAEAQARESQVQLALERVRARTMAMQKSEDLNKAASDMFKQIQSLGMHPWACGFNIFDKDEKTVTQYMSLADGGISPPFRTPLTEDPFFINIYEARKRSEKLLVWESKGDSLVKTYRYMFGLPGSREIFGDLESSGFEMPKFQITHCAYFSQGYLVFITYENVPEAHDIFIRFAKTFEQTYTRFLDLQKAEGQARESQIEAALEKVRSRTLAMQKSDELAETAAVLFQQLIALGIEPNRLYISIIKNDTDEAEFWITEEDGTKVSTAYSANLNENTAFAKMYEGWKREHKSLVIDMQGEELQNYFRHLSSLGVPFKGGLEQKRRVQDIAYFSKGFIGMASTEEQPAETLQLLERFAAVFNLTFTRFHDLKIAEAHAIQAELDLIEIKAARKKAEDTLTELQATQKQLIQSEKMASLGELTAGIAHEIQNPLNFVNNFSEVSSELIDEMKAELATGNQQLATEIADDIKQNLEKINHHGKRADSIVKGMLQHSQKSTGEKIPTDINSLADEFLRLAYHGLRAKDKMFNATLHSDFDKSIEKINIIPQDVGRVILNIVTNAFYAVNEKKKEGNKNYQPIVSLTTRKLPDAVQISIEDNGGGIPKDIINKIFQPFFTTKPTGQGTGLGLSLAYDIVKAHGGELNVETKENEGTTFIILLKQQM